MGYKVDYHIHTYYSDGTMKPTEVVRRFSEKGYDMIAITDHDGVDAIKEAVIAGEALKIQVIKGIEFGTDCRYGDVITERDIILMKTIRNFRRDLQTSEQREWREMTDFWL